MPPPLIGLIVDQLGFLTGLVLYTMLLVMVWRERAGAAVPSQGQRWRLPALTGAVGVIWNVGALMALGGAAPAPSPVIVATAFAALGFLPAVVVHAVLEGRETAARAAERRATAALAYALSSVAGLLHVVAALGGQAVPSPLALWILTIGFTALAALLLFRTRDQPAGRRGVWVIALAIFSVSAVHFNRHAGDEAWWVELVGHHASLPLAVAILHQDYRFAFADLFLKHALALLMLVASGLLIAVAVVLPWLGRIETRGVFEPGVVMLVLLAWIGTAVLYGRFRHWAGRIVDRTLLRRPDYGKQLEALSHALDRAATEAAAVEATAEGLRAALGPSSLRVGGAPAAPAETAVLIRTVDAPQPTLMLGPPAGGRRWLSDDLQWARTVGALAAQRIDALRVTQERHARDLREQAMERLATEAQLRALRAQVQPHFLFNALTTIGYLIQHAPPRALDTLLRLTEVLRGVLTRASREFSTLGDEIDLIRAYLDIERARFEERLEVTFAVPADTRPCLVPTLLLQPLVENAVKHGIGGKAAGGNISVRARVDNGGRLVITVADSGAGFGTGTTAGSGLGLRSVQERLRAHYGDAASLAVDSAVGVGTVVEVTMPLAGRPSTDTRPPLVAHL